MRQSGPVLAITVNVGCGGPHPPGRPAAMTEWAREAAGHHPGLVFAQEVPADPAWLRVWKRAGYRAPIWGIEKPWSTRSALLARDDVVLEQLPVGEPPSLDHHGTYVAVAWWLNGQADRPVVVASVHASPTPAEVQRYGWPYREPSARNGGPHSRWPNRQLWDADLLLVTLRRHAGEGLIAAGDFNEMLTGDPEGETWAREYYRRVRGTGLRDALIEAWTREQPTRFPPDGGQPVQLDHVLTDSVGRKLVPGEPKPYLDARWQQLAADGLPTGDLSDHSPVWFHIADPASSRLEP